MSTLDWPSVDANGVSLPTIVSSTDLFDGELFGDELMDIYNSAVVGESASDASVHNEIPMLPHPGASSDTSADAKKQETDETVQIAAAAAAIDDGLGAFRPSTSFSDLTTLLPPTPGDVRSTEVPAVAPVTTTSAGTTEQKQTKKRPVPESTEAHTVSPPAKRKATLKTAVRRVSEPVKKETTTATPATTAPAVVQETTGRKPDTPDPLVVETKPTNVATATPVAAPKETLKTQPVVSATAPATSTPALAQPAAIPALPAVKPAQAQPAPPAEVPSSTTAKTEQTSPAPSVASKSSESDFQSIAQVAVSNLMMTVTSSQKPETESSSTPKVDTSTDHIKALTGNNWVAACPTTTCVTAAAPVNDSKANNRARRQNLTPDERARQNRDRNREHARNTRLRKKAYVEELKRTLTELVSQRDANECDKRQAAQRELEQREVRFRVIEEFLKLRGRNETNFARWAAILEDGFSLALPLNDYCKVVQSATRTGFDQVVRGVSDVMADSSNFSEFLQTFGNGNSQGKQ